MQYPENILTKSRSGRIEVRKLMKRGKFVQYQYLDASTGKIAEKKIKLMLKSGENIESYYLIPIKGGRYLMIPDKEPSQGKKVLDGKKANSGSHTATMF